jgi:hypothetical protein
MPTKAPAPVRPVAGKNSTDDHPILFQKFFKSMGPRTYAAQVKQAANGNHYLILTEGYRKPDSDEVRKSRIFLYSEDFVQFFRMLHETAQWIKANPLPEEVKQKRERYWKKQREESAGSRQSQRVVVSSR